MILLECERRISCDFDETQTMLSTGIMVFIIDHLVEGGKDRELIMTGSTKGPSMVEVYWECVVSCTGIIIRIQDDG